MKYKIIEKKKKKKNQHNQQSVLQTEKQNWQTFDQI